MTTGASGETILSRIVSIFTILAIVGGLYGYFSSEHSKRVDKTFEFYKTLRTDPLRKDWELLAFRYNQSSEKAKALLDQGKDDELAALSISLINDQQSREAFDHITDFFNEFYSCIQQLLCDNNSAVALTRMSAKEFVSAYGPYIEHLREKTGNEEIGFGVYNIISMTPRFNLFEMIGSSWFL